MIDSNPTGQKTAQSMKGDIVSALILNSEEAGSLVVQDSSESKPTAFLTRKYMEGRTLAKMAGLGWVLDMAWAENRKVKAMFTLTGETN